MKALLLHDGLPYVLRGSKGSKSEQKGVHIFRYYSLRYV